MARHWCELDIMSILHRLCFGSQLSILFNFPEENYSHPNTSWCPRICWKCYNLDIKWSSGYGNIMPLYSHLVLPVIAITMEYLPFNLIRITRETMNKIIGLLDNSFIMGLTPFVLQVIPELFENHFIVLPHWDITRLAREFRLYMDFYILTGISKSIYTAWILGLSLCVHTDLNPVRSHYSDN